MNCNSESNQASARARRHLPAKKVFSVLFFPPEALGGRRGFSIASDLSLFFFSKEEKSKKIINFKEKHAFREMRSFRLSTDGASIAGHILYIYFTLTIVVNAKWPATPQFDHPIAKNNSASFAFFIFRAP